MLSELDEIVISSEQETPIQPTVIEEEFMSMLFGSSYIPKIKRQAQNPSSMPPSKRHTRTLDRV